MPTYMVQCDTCCHIQEVRQSYDIEDTVKTCSYCQNDMCSHCPQENEMHKQCMIDSAEDEKDDE